MVSIFKYGGAGGATLVIVGVGCLQGGMFFLLVVDGLSMALRPRGWWCRRVGAGHD